MSDEQNQGWTRRLLVYGPIVLLLLVAASYITVTLVSRSRSNALLSRAQVRVVTPDGQLVAGVRILAYWDQLLRNNARALGETDADGRVALDELADTWGTFGRYELRVALPGTPATVTPLVEDTRIVVPVFGSLRARLVDQDGGPWRDPPPLPATAHLSGAGRDDTAWFDTNGEARFPQVACNSGMRLDVSLHGYRPASPAPDCSPAAPGVERVVDVVIPDTVPRLVGRVVDARGEPVSGTFRMDVQLASKDTMTVLAGPHGAADEQGRFVFFVSVDATSANVTIRHPEHGEASATAKADGPVLDLGTLAFPAR